MFEFLKFSWLLKFIYLTTKLSGFLYISIDFKSKDLEVKKQFLNVIAFIISFGLSLIASSYDAYLPVAHVTHSRLLDMGVNISIHISVWLASLMKPINVVQSNRFFKTLSILHRLERQVSTNIYQASIVTTDKKY